MLYFGTPKAAEMLCRIAEFPEPAGEKHCPQKEYTTWTAELRVQQKSMGAAGRCWVGAGELLS